LAVLVEPLLIVRAGQWCYFKIKELEIEETIHLMEK